MYAVCRRDALRTRLGAAASIAIRECPRPRVCNTCFIYPIVLLSLQTNHKHVPQAIRQMIATRFDSLSPELQRAARWVSRHGAAIALHSMRDSARAAGVTPATMTRLARRLDFDGFEGLREPFRRQLAGNGSGAEFERCCDSAGAGAAAADVLVPLNAMQQANVASVGRTQSDE